MTDKGKQPDIPPQQQAHRPGYESEMQPRPAAQPSDYSGSGKLRDKVALITGGDSGIGRAIAVLFAREGAEVAINYLEEGSDARETARLVEQEGRGCQLLRGDVGRESFCQELVAEVVKRFGRLDILINNAGEQHPQDSIEKLSSEQLEHTFRTNIFAMFYLVKAALPHLNEGSTIVNSASITAYQGNPSLLDYSATKGAIVAFTRSLSLSLIARGIRVNAVAPGPIWTPLIPSTFPPDKVASFGKNTPMGRPGQPEEVAPCYLFLACADSSYISGQVLHPNGGRIVNG